MKMRSAYASVSLRTFLLRPMWLCMAPLLLLALWLSHTNVDDVRAHQRADAVHLGACLLARVDDELGARIATRTTLAESTHLDSESGLARFYAQAQGFREAFRQTNPLVGDALRPTWWAV